MRPKGWWQVQNHHTVILAIAKSLLWLRFNLLFAMQIMLINLEQTCTNMSEGDCKFLLWSKADSEQNKILKNCVHSLTVCFSGRPFKEAAFHQTFTPRLDFLWSIATQFFVAIHLFECFPAQLPILHFPPVLQFALSITLLSMVHHTLILASLRLVGFHCRSRRLLVSSFTGFFFFWDGFKLDFSKSLRKSLLYYSHI